MTRYGCHTSIANTLSRFDEPSPDGAGAVPARPRQSPPWQCASRAAFVDGVETDSNAGKLHGGVDVEVYAVSTPKTRPRSDRSRTRRGCLAQVGHDLAVEEQDLVGEVGGGAVGTEPGGADAFPDSGHMIAGGLSLGAHSLNVAWGTDSCGGLVRGVAAVSPTSIPDRRGGSVAMGDGRDAELERALASLAGRRVDDVEVAAIVTQARTLPDDRGNVIWAQLRRALRRCRCARLPGPDVAVRVAGSVVEGLRRSDVTVVVHPWLSVSRTTVLDGCPPRAPDQ